MSLFIDSHNRRKSPILLVAFSAALAEAAFFWGLYMFLAEPLYRLVALPNVFLTNLAHALIVSVIGTAVCCLLFLLEDKRMAPYGFVGMAVVLGMFCAASLLLEADVRGDMLRWLFTFFLPPVVVGCAVTWPIYLELKRRNPAMNDRKTLAEELREAAEQEAAKHPKPEKEADIDPIPEEYADISATEAMFGPDEETHSFAAHSAQEEAMLLFVDDEEESDD